MFTHCEALFYVEVLKEIDKQVSFMLSFVFEYLGEL